MYMDLACQVKIAFLGHYILFFTFFGQNLALFTIYIAYFGVLLDENTVFEIG